MKFRLAMWALFAAGVAVLGLAGSLVADTRSFLARAQTANGVVVDLVASHSTSSSFGRNSQDVYCPVVEFAGPGGRPITFRSDTGTSPPAFRRGEKVIVHYDPAEPEKARLDGFFDLWFFPALVGGFGAIALFIGCVGLLLERSERLRTERLKRNGARLETTFQGVERKTNVSVNGRNPFRIVSRWLDPSTNEVHLFESENLWFDPTEFVRDRPITVYAERGNLRRYQMDVSFLPKLAA
jgi:hypothetical protein